MGLKRGYIVADTTPTVRDARIRRVRLHSGDQVYVPLSVLRGLLERHSPAAEFFFVERGFLGRTAWAGTLAELQAAVSQGIVSIRELGTVPEELFGISDEWADVDIGYDHLRDAAKLETYRAAFEKSRRPQEAVSLTRDSWIATGHRDGCCMKVNIDPRHGSVWCTLDAGHHGRHEPECPECWLTHMLDARIAQASDNRAALDISEEQPTTTPEPGSGPNDWESLERDSPKWRRGQIAFREALNGNPISEGDQYLAFSYANSRSDSDIFDDLGTRVGHQEDIDARYLKDRTRLGRLVDHLTGKG